MKKMLLVVATRLEANPLLNLHPHLVSDYLPIGRYRVRLLVTGTGAPATAFSLMKHAFDRENRPDVVVNMGVAGSYQSHISPGMVFQVSHDTFADLGIDDRGTFIPWVETAWNEDYQEYFINGWLRPTAIVGEQLFAKAKGLSGNTVSGSEGMIAERKLRFQADLETMEGATVMYLCHRLQWPVMALRSVSNYVEPRDKSRWNMPLAINELNKACVQLFDSDIDI